MRVAAQEQKSSDAEVLARTSATVSFNYRNEHKS